MLSGKCKHGARGIDKDTKEVTGWKRRNLEDSCYLFYKVKIKGSGIGERTDKVERPAQVRERAKELSGEKTFFSAASA